MENTKYCRRCEETKSVADYFPHPQHADGLQSFCKACMGRMRNPEWKPNNFVVNNSLIGEGLRSCAVCRQHKSLDEFTVNNYTKHKIEVTCRPCSAMLRHKRRSQNPVTYLLKDLRTRARKKKVPFNLTHDYLTSLLEQQTVCQVTGLPFVPTKEGEKFMSNPYHASVDRIIPAQGYTIDNVRFVLWSVNMAMSTWGEEVFLSVARAAVANALPKRPTI